MTAKQEVVVEEDGDRDDYWQHRFRQARKAGLTRVEANLFADGDVPCATLRKCVEGGARPETIARVVC